MFRGVIDPIGTLTTDGTPLSIFNAQRPTVSTLQSEAETLRPYFYDYYSIDVPDFHENQYLVVNISRVEPFYDDFPVLRLHYEKLPQSILDTGVVESSDSQTDDDDDSVCFYKHCVDMRNSPKPFYEHPIQDDPRETCECKPFVQSFGNTFQLTCNLTVDPCFFQTGRWYASVQLPNRARPTNPVDNSGRLNYTIFAVTRFPTVTELERNTTFKGFVEPEQATHYKIEIDEDDLNVGESHLFVQISNIRGATLDMWIHQGQPNSGGTRDVAGGPEACSTANVTCRSCDACNLVVEKCYLVPGTWYISLNIPYINDRFLVEDASRLPATFTIRANWREDPTPTRLLAGIPVHKFVGENIYDFYVVDVPPTVDTWLFAELYTHSPDTEVILSMLHGEIPGGECYARPDFYCLTGDPRGTTISTGPPQFLDDAYVARESCTFMIQTCELESGPLYLSVFGHRLNYNPYGDNTFYQIPVQYTLWVDFDVALALDSGVAYSEHVFEEQYNHYYIRADEVDQGSWMTVEVTNIQHGIPPTVETFVNFNFLAGNCPCYDHLYNCTGAFKPKCDEEARFDVQGNYPGNTDPDNGETPEIDMVNNCCTIVIPPCVFRAGVWYISVLGVNENLVEYTTPIGYTLTATVHKPPEVSGLVLGTPTPAVVPQWNQTNQYTHFKLAAEAIPHHDLVIELTYVQNCEFQGKHDNLRDQLDLYVNKNNVATDECYWWTCTANVESDSICTVVIPECEWTMSNNPLAVKYYGATGEDDFLFISVKGDYSAIFEGRFTVHAYPVEVSTQQIRDGVAVYGRVANRLYDHYYFPVNPDGLHDLLIDMYTNADQDRVTMYLNREDQAGASPCFTHLPDYVCSDTSCSWQIQACDLVEGQYFISVYGGVIGQPDFFYNIPVEYTLTASYTPTLRQVFNLTPLTAVTNAGQINHYSYVASDVSTGDFLLIKVENVRHGHVRVFANMPDDDDETGLAGPCPCYKFDLTCDARGSDCDQDRNTKDPNWCELRVPVCLFTQGTYTFSVLGISTVDPDRDLQPNNPFTTRIGYTVEVDQISSNVEEIELERTRQLDNQLQFEFVANERFNHYRFSLDDDDMGYQIIVEISGVREGGLYAYYNPLQVSDSDVRCQVARICSTRGVMTPGSTCSWQVPYCLTQEGEHYITIEGVTGRRSTIYNLLVWQQRWVDLPELINPDNFTSNNLPASNTVNEANITHFYTNEPNGWVQFIKLSDVVDNDIDLEGDILEVFFYRIQNNRGEGITFDAYLWPDEPAGPRECCGPSFPGGPEPTPDQLGVCQRMPCAHHAETTSDTNSNRDAIASTTCYPNQVGVGADPTNPFPGPGTCTITVWGCELAKLVNEDGNNDWWLTIIPSAGSIRTDPPNPTLPGLSYSVAWRTRNVRRGSTNTNGTVANLSDNTSGDLTQYINTNLTNGYTPFFQVAGFQGWRSFFFTVDLSDELRRRVVVQTEFQSTTTPPEENPDASVYIRPAANANPLDCNEYYCPSVGGSSVCNDLNDRYISTACCTESQDYYISVRNQEASGVAVSFRFRITVLPEPETIEIPEDPVIQSPFNITVNGTEGIEGENIQHYSLVIDDDDFSDHENLNIILYRNDTTAGDLVLYLRKTVKGGPYMGASSNFYDEPEGCYTYQYTCTAAQTSNERCCSLQIPHCQLIPGEWFISVYNPTFDLDNTIDKLGYNLEVYFGNPPIDLELGVTFFNNGTNNSTLLDRCDGFYQHHRVEVTSDDIGYDPRDELEGYYAKYLRFQLQGITGSQVSMYVNYDDVAGDSSECDCLDNFASQLNCENSGTDICVIDVAPCTTPGNVRTVPKLISGTYYVSLFIAGAQPTGYQLLASVQTLNFTRIPGVAVPNFREEDNTDVIWTVRPEPPHPTENRYVIDTNDFKDDDDDDLDADTYMIGRLSVDVPVANAAMKVEVWRDDCYRWECSITSEQECFIDAIELAPCSVKGGRYYFSVENPNALNFTLEWFWNTTHQETVENNQTLAEDIYTYEYQEFVFDADLGDIDGGTLQIDIEAAAGVVEAWINPLNIAGPGRDSTQTALKCHIDYCRTTPSTEITPFGTPASTCSLFIDTCDLRSQRYYIAVRGVTQLYPPAVAGVTVTNFTNTAIHYTLHAYQTDIQFANTDFYGCPRYVSYSNPVSQQPRQYHILVDDVLPGGRLRFTMRVPTQAIIEGDVDPRVATLHIARNRSVGYTEECIDQVGAYDDVTSFTCSITTTRADLSDAARTCYINLSPCYAKLGQYYILADAPRGTELIVEKFDMVIPIVRAGLIEATVSADPVPSSLLDQPLRYGLQHYRVNFNAIDRDFQLRANLYGLRNDDQATLIINDGLFPLLPNEVSPANLCNPSLWTCQNPATATANCTLYINKCDLAQHIPPIEIEECTPQTNSCNGDLSCMRCGQQPDSFLYVTVQGMQQTCELHSIPFKLHIDTRAQNVQDRNIGETFCGAVWEGDYSYYNLFPLVTPQPQEEYLQIEVLGVELPDSVDVLLQDGFVPSVGTTGGLYPYIPQCNLAENPTVATTDPIYGSVKFNYYCAYGHTSPDDPYNTIFGDDDETDDDEGLRLGVFGLNSDTDTEPIRYCVKTTRIDAQVRELEDNVRLIVNDDDDDVCPHEHDFFRYTTQGNDEDGVFLEVSIKSSDDFQAYLNEGGLAWNGCTNTDYCERVDDPTDDDDENECKLHAFCNYNPSGTYYVTVVSQTSYSVMATEITDSVEMELFETTDDELEIGTWKTYYFDVPEEDVDPRSRLVVLMEGAAHGSLRGYIRKDNVGGPFRLPGDTSDRWCSINQWDKQNDVPAASATAVFPPNGQSTAFSNLLVDTCCLEAGRYYVTLFAPESESLQSNRNCLPVSFRITPIIQLADLPIVEIESGVALTDQRISLYNIDRLERYESRPRYRYYGIDSSQTFPGFGQVRVANVQNGRVRLYAKANHLASFEYAFWNNDIAWVDNDFNQEIISGQREFSNQRFNQDWRNKLSPVNPSCPGCNDRCCETGYDTDSVDDDDIKEPFTWFQSCAIWVDSCMWSDAFVFYAVEALDEDYEDHSITYDIETREYQNFGALSNEQDHTAQSTDNNWEYHFYAFSQDSQSSVSLAVVVNEGQGVLVDVYDDPCPGCANYHRQMWCDRRYSEIRDSWVCRIEIPTRADHPGRDVNNFYVSVLAKNAQFTLAVGQGRENCVEYSGSDLSFCRGLPYSTWAWSDAQSQDRDSLCLFNELYEHFRVQPCWSGVTPECNDTLQRFACYENFRRCDKDGFQTPTCRGACENVVYECVNWFESVDLEAYNCTSDRYINEDLDNECTGHLENDRPHWEPVDDILYKSAPPPSTDDDDSSASSATSLTASVVLSIFVAVFSLFF